MNISDHLNELYHLSKWTRQTEYIDTLNIKDPQKWLIEIDKLFNKIPSDRKDKFYYLVDVISTKISISFLDELPNLRNYILKKNIINFSTQDILSYLLKYRVFDYKPFKQVEFNKEDIKDILKGDKVLNRDLFYILLK